MRQTDLKNELESFTTLEELPQCGNIQRGKELHVQIKRRSSLDSRRKLLFILNNLSLPAGGNVLEIGPGCCNLALEFFQRGFNYYGYDMVDKNIEKIAIDCLSPGDG